MELIYQNLFFINGNFLPSLTNPKFLLTISSVFLLTSSIFLQTVDFTAPTAATTINCRKLTWPKDPWDSWELMHHHAEVETLHDQLHDASICCSDDCHQSPDLQLLALQIQLYLQDFRKWNYTLKLLYACLHVQYKLV